MDRFKAYIVSFRLRTLPLSVAGIILGILLAAKNVQLNELVVVLLLITTLSLQILSNLANELGDALKGTDNHDRLGPIRSLQTGALTKKDLLNCIFAFVLLCVISGIALLYFALDSLFSEQGIIFLMLGAAAILCAILYTVGRYAFGYRGLGDIFVFLFFGWVSTIGAYMLCGAPWTLWLFLPASAIGMLSCGVLNINNIRDRENDANCGKRTLVVRIGDRGARVYHYFLVVGAFVFLTLFNLYSGIAPSYWYFITLPIFVMHLRAMAVQNGKDLDKQMPVLALSTLLFSILAGL
ncbi:MAG: 1,4-dihydroxy-2-naphthoate octaprenyltransferase [Marinifilaceae bacterium]